MAINRASLPKQLKKIKGQNHMLAYITPKEADQLVTSGGREVMTEEGIPAYPPWDSYDSDSYTSHGGGGGGGSGRDNYRPTHTIAEVTGPSLPVAPPSILNPPAPDYRDVHDTGAVAMTPGREKWGPGVGGTPHIPKVRKPVFTGDQRGVVDWPFKMMKKGGRVTGIAKRGFGRALKKGKK